MDLQPGDALSFVVPNPAAECEALVARMGLSPESMVRVELDPNTGKKRAKVPDFVPGEGCSLMELLQWHLDIRSVPKKVGHLEIL